MPIAYPTECRACEPMTMVKMPKPIRFYAGDTVRYCASYETETESTCIVPASFGTTHAVDRAILLGGQSLAQAFGITECQLHGGSFNVV